MKKKVLSEPQTEFTESIIASPWKPNQERWHSFSKVDSAHYSLPLITAPFSHLLAHQPWSKSWTYSAACSPVPLPVIAWLLLASLCTSTMVECSCKVWKQHRPRLSSKSTLWLYFSFIYFDSSLGSIHRKHYCKNLRKISISICSHSISHTREWMSREDCKKTQ